MSTEKGKYVSPEGSRIWEYIAFCTCSIMAMCIGSVVGWNSPSIVKLMAPDSPIAVTISDISTLVATVCVGHMLAPPFNSLVVDRIGRKNTTILSALPLLISWGLIIVATNIWILYVARFMAGLSLGVFLCVFPMYVGEIASPSTRGVGGALNTIMFNLGILGTFIVVPYLSISAMAGVFLAITVAFIICFWFMPDSPYYLAMRNRMDDAEETLEKLRGKNDVSEELEDIVRSVSCNKDRERWTDSVGKLLAVRGNRHAFIISNLFVVTHNLGGFFVIIMYGQLIFQSTADDGRLYDRTANIAIGVVQVVGAITITFLIDRLGRKPLILFSGCVAAVCNLVIGLFFYAKDYLDVDLSAYSTAPFVSSILLVFAFNCGLLGIHFTVMSEIFATEIKSLAICLLSIISGFLSVITSKAYILVAVTWDYGHSPPFLAFFVIVTVSTAVILHLSPETKGKTFVQIQKELND